MDNTDLISSYNYNAFIPQNFEPWMRFDHSPPLAVTAPDFPLWDLDENQTSLRKIWSQHTYTIVEFGSFT